MGLKPSRREPASSSRTAHPRSSGNGTSASRCCDNSSQYRSTVSTSPGASTAMPTMTTGSGSRTPLAEPLSSIVIDMSGDVGDVIGQVEVPAVIPRQGECPPSVLYPGAQHVGGDPVITAAAEGVDVGANRLAGRTVVPVERPIIPAQRVGEHDAEFLVGEQAWIGAAHIGEIGEQSRIVGGQIRQPGDYRRGRTGGRPQGVHDGVTALGDARELEGDQGAHAVPE